MRFENKSSFKKSKRESSLTRKTFGLREMITAHRIPSSSGLSGRDKITPPDVEEIIKSRMGQTRGEEISLGNTEPKFLHKGRGGADSDDESDPKLLTSDEWKSLKASLCAVEMAYYTLQ